MDHHGKAQTTRLQNHLLWRDLLDSLTNHLCIITTDGVIEYVNQAWIDFARGNCASESLIGVGINYLDVCDASARRGDELSAAVAQAIRKVAADESQFESIEYPCHSPNEERWFSARITKLGNGFSDFLVVDHHNITERKLAERKVQTLVRLDPLTSLINRRYFDEFAETEWRRAIRHQLMVSIAMIDCDRFKQINDQYGHQIGDQLLIIIAKALQDITRRPGDVAVRYGGDEFLIYQAETDAAVLSELFSQVAHRVASEGLRLGIEGVSLSIGIADVTPREECDVDDLIKRADNALYQAKLNGRNQIRIASPVGTME